MIRTLSTLALAAAIGLTFAPGIASAKKKAPQSSSIASKGKRVCRHTFATGETKTWVCPKTSDCCAADIVNYTACGGQDLFCW